MSSIADFAVIHAHPGIDLSPAVADRRAYERLSTSALSWLNQVRIKYGPAVALIDLSAGGAQIETISHRLEPGRTVVIEIDGHDCELSVPSRIVRCGVSGIVPEITYRGALEFKRLLEIPALRERTPFMHEIDRFLGTVGRSAQADRSKPTPSEPIAPADDQAMARGSKIDGWHRLVVRYRDGRMMKGFGRDFYPAKGLIHVWPAVDAPNRARIGVRLAQLKAVFFVHDFDGGQPIDPGIAALSGGRRIVVTFLDGEVLDARTLNYSAEAPGFFVSPVDQTTNNERIFVVNASVAQVQFV